MSCESCSQERVLVGRRYQKQHQDDPVYIGIYINFKTRRIETELIDAYERTPYLGNTVEVESAISCCPFCGEVLEDFQTELIL